jgi:mono/diheme cytochrome c family protein/peroxiredoxin
MNGAGPASERSLSPLAAVVAGLLSLVVCAVAGWAFRAYRDAPSHEPINVTESAQEPPSPNPQGRGKLIYQIHCARCHGAAGHGDGSDAPTLHPPPRDFAIAPWRTAPTPSAVRRTIAEGVPGTAMIGMASALSPRELDAVADFVLGFAPASLPLNTADLLKSAGFRPIAPARPAPPLNALGLDGATVALDQLRGRLVLVVFWGTSCAPCLEEMPDLQALAARFRDDALTILPICADETDAAQVSRAAAARAPRFPVFTDPTGMAKLACDVQALPTALLIDPRGLLLGRAEGSMKWSAPEMDVLIRACLPRNARM